MPLWNFPFKTYQKQCHGELSDIGSTVKPFNAERHDSIVQTSNGVKSHDLATSLASLEHIIASDGLDSSADVNDTDNVLGDIV